jgi:hypothetical protein
MKSAYKTLAGKSKRDEHLRDSKGPMWYELTEPPREVVDWIQLPQDNVQWRAVVNTAMKFQITQKAGSQEGLCPTEVRNKRVGGPRIYDDSSNEKNWTPIQGPNPWPSIPMLVTLLSDGRCIISATNFFMSTMMGMSIAFCFLSQVRILSKNLYI